MTFSGLTQCLVIYPKCWLNIHKACLSTLHHPVGLDTCDHTIIIKVVLVQLQSHLHQWTVDIKTEFFDLLEEYIEIISYPHEPAQCKVY
jgi:hypothetical protein